MERDTRAIILNENFVPDITPTLIKLTDTLILAQEENTKIQQQNQVYYDEKRRKDPAYLPGDRVWIKMHPQSKANQKYTAKFAPKRDGPYIILRKRGSASYEVGDKDGYCIGNHLTSSITRCIITNDILQVQQRKKRGRPL